MFGLGMPEILLILAIALIVIGPKKLPDLAKTLGRAMGEFKRSAQDFKASIDIETTVKDITDLETPATDLKKAVEEANQEANATESDPDKSNDSKISDTPKPDKTSPEETAPDKPSEDFNSDSEGSDADFTDTDESLTDNDPYNDTKDSNSDTTQTTTEDKKTE